MEEKADEARAAPLNPLTDAELRETREWFERAANDTTIPASFLAPRALRALAEVREARRLLGEAAEWIEAAEGAYGSPSLSVAARPRLKRIRSFLGEKNG